MSRKELEELVLEALHKPNSKFIQQILEEIEKEEKECHQ